MNFPLELVMGLALITQGEQPKMRVLMCDQTGLDEVVWSRTRMETIRIFEHAGVTLDWIDSEQVDTQCKLHSGAIRFVVVLSPAAPKGWTGPDVMGFAPANTSRAYVFYDLIERFMHNFLSTTNARTTAAIVLAHAISHELGHMLIPGNPHGQGIMQPTWSYREWTRLLEGTLWFSPDHAKVIRQQLKLK